MFPMLVFDKLNLSLLILHVLCALKAQSGETDVSAELNVKTSINKAPEPAHSTHPAEKVARLFIYFPTFAFGNTKVIYQS